jgi:hypothetical protein
LDLIFWKPGIVALVAQLSTSRRAAKNFLDIWSAAIWDIAQAWSFDPHETV